MRAACELGRLDEANEISGIDDAALEHHRLDPVQG